ncbi:MAG: hypothetical protein LC794_02655 [Acidobacteria bacterium]|nr:hypothetical protein [Acidobacteriota bacterium]
MAETKESQQNLGAIRTDIEQIRAMQRFTTAATASNRAFAEDHLGEMVGAAEVYLSLQNGPLNLDEIMAIVKKSKAQSVKNLQSPRSVRFHCQDS